ncbi:MAG: LiaF-related protein [Bacilli bacterium]|nr:LiaF-related protein [Bacilli bacterium]MDD3305456.1 LiaF-related protein [Bacilli bacterium]MDD4053949.1 LiaF-related protein [Bacilli bacterium]MDD4411209.1 LiaF-related protein [Bacilli bacterium]
MKRIIGLIIILIGMLLLLSNLEIVSFEDLSGVVFSVAIIIIGLAGLIEKRRFDFILVMFVIFGGLYLFANLGIVDESMLDNIIGPVFLMVVGFSLLISVTKRVSTKPVTSYIAVFSGVEDKNESKEYVSSDITAIFGGAEIDFRKIKIKDKVGYINATAMFGGVTVMVPEDVKVTVKGYPIFGGAENKTLSNSDAKTELVINYTAMFGGVEIKN